MKKYFTLLPIIFFTILSVSTYSQVKVVLTEGVPIFKASLFEKQLLQYAIDEQPEKSSGKFSGVISDYRLRNDIGDFKFDTYSAPKSMIYGVIILFSEIEESPEIDKGFRKIFEDLAFTKFWSTFEFSDKLLKIRDKSSYLLYLDSLENFVSPYYNIVDKKGKKILDSISTVYSYIFKTNTKITRNTNVDKLSANKNWEPSFTLFDAFTDKPIAIEKGNPPYYNLFIFNENDNIDSLLNLRLSDMQNDYSSTYRNWGYSVNKLSSIKGIKFQNFDNFYNWVKTKYPEKFVRTELSNSSKSQNSKSSDISNTETSENKNLESFLKLLASSNNNSSRTQSISSNQSGKCNDCNGTGKCRGCNRVFQKPYFTNGYYNKRSEIKLGYTLCQSCMGKGFKDRSIGSGYQIIGDCPSSKCQDGWEGCYLCNLGGQRRDIGQCVKCRGTGRK
jgi:hypothetical protein